MLYEINNYQYHGDLHSVDYSHDHGIFYISGPPAEDNNPTYQIVPESSSIRPPRPTSTNVRPTNRQNPTQARQPSYQTYPGMYDINSYYGPYNPNNFYMPDYDFYMPQYYP
uniref:Uncharacterized protein n=1 Tax=Acrobeloides nanus TaxID=290746 RepID=A0A914CHX2_9BILA